MRIEKTFFVFCHCYALNWTGCCTCTTSGTLFLVCNGYHFPFLIFCLITTDICFRSFLLNPKNHMNMTFMMTDERMVVKNLTKDSSNKYVIPQHIQKAGRQALKIGMTVLLKYSCMEKLSIFL